MEKISTVKTKGKKILKGQLTESDDRSGIEKPGRAKEFVPNSRARPPSLGDCG